MYQKKDRKTIPLFKDLFRFGGSLNGKNDWIKLSELIPWEKLEGVYEKYFIKDRGRPAKEGRLICGMLIAKHREKLSDRDVVRTLSENPYIQYFCGFEQFVTDERIIHPSLLLKKRKILGKEFFQLFEGEVFRVLIEHGLMRAKEQLIDATVVPANISYPTDCKLLNRAREWLCGTILKVRKICGIKEKVRTYRRVAKKTYLSFTKRRKKTKAFVRKVQGKMLRFLRRNIHQMEAVLKKVPRERKRVKEKVSAQLNVIKQLYKQQREMWEKGVRRVKDRIVSLHRPHIRPMVRGKEGKEVEFGPKVVLSAVDGYGFMNHFSFDAYNESGYLQGSVEHYEELFKKKPSVAVADKIFGTRENRDYLQERGIKAAFKSLGRPRRTADKRARDWLAKQQRKRNQVEGLIGTGKTRYGLERILYRILEGEEIWVRMGLMGMNLNRALKRMT
jgi:hypothetical protein